METNTKERISEALDGELSEAQLHALLGELRQDNQVQLVKIWDEYHHIGDVLRSDDLDIRMSTDFSKKVMAQLKSEPTLMVPQAIKVAASPSNGAPSLKASRYMAFSSIAAAVMVAFVMAPQIISILNHTDGGSNVATKVESNDNFAGNIKLASNSGNATSIGNPSVPVLLANSAKEAEFAPKLEDQVEMLRDPRLDSYLQAHQKVSPTLESGARHIQKANVVPTPDEK